MATVERARGRVIGNVFREAATNGFRSYRVLQVLQRMKFTVSWEATGRCRQRSVKGQGWKQGD